MIHKRSGFTLIELLVVISIISLLIAILLPVLQSARSAAQSIKCLSGLRQIDLSMLMYADSNKVYLPPSAVDTGTGNPNTDRKYWTAFLYEARYLSTGVVYVCPSSRSEKASFWLKLQPTVDINSSQFGYPDYGYNSQFIGRSQGSYGPSEMPARLTDIKKASQTVVLADDQYARYSPSPQPFGSYFLATAAATNATKGYMEARHLQAVNVGWADGHATDQKVPSTPTVAGPNEYSTVFTHGNSIGDPLNLFDRE